MGGDGLRWLEMGGDGWRYGIYGDWNLEKETINSWD